MEIDVRFTNFTYNPSKYYFVFISELKAYGLGYFFKEALSKAYGIDKDTIEFVSIAPDVFEQYNYENLIIIGSVGPNENKRKSHDQFVKEISECSYVNAIVDEILLNQQELFVYMFESSKYMTLDQKKGVVLVGPKVDVVETLSNKIKLYEIFSQSVPMAPYRVCDGLAELQSESIQFFSEQKRLFVSLESSAAGANSIIAHSLDDIEKKFDNSTDAKFLVCEFIPHLFDPTSLGVVINEEEVYVAGVADQRIDGTKFKGSTFPSQLPKYVQEEIIALTRTVGKKMAKMGYRGIFGCDFIVTEDEKIYFIETNPRKQGTTMEFCCTLKMQLPISAPNLPEIELYAVTESKKAPRLKEPEVLAESIFWGTYNYKIQERLTTHSYLPQQTDEIKMFQNIAKNKIKKEFMIVEHIGQDFFVNEGSFLGRVIAVGKSHKDVEDGIEMGKRMISYTIEKYVDDDFVLEERCYQCKYYLQSC